MLFLGIVIRFARILAFGRRKQNARFQLEVMKRPESWNPADAKLPYVAFGFVAKHRRPAVALAAPRNFLTDL